VTGTRDLHRRLLAEFLGSAFLAAIVIGSGIVTPAEAVGVVVPHVGSTRTLTT
jgi:hypothetical protein